MRFSSDPSSRKRCGDAGGNPGHWGYRRQRKRVQYPDGKEAGLRGGLRDGCNGLFWATGEVWMSDSQHNPAVDSKNILPLQ